MSQFPLGLAASPCPAQAPRSVFLSISLKEIFKVQVFGSASKNLRANFSMTCLQASCLECIVRDQWGAGCWGGDAGATPGPSQAEECQARRGVFPRSWLCAQHLPTPFPPPRVEPVLVLSHLDSFLSRPWLIDGQSAAQIKASQTKLQDRHISKATVAVSGTAREEQASLGARRLVLRRAHLRVLVPCMQAPQDWHVGKHRMGVSLRNCKPTAA